MEMNPQDMQDFEKVVLAGMKLMYDERTFGIFKQGMMKQDVPLPQRLAMEAAGLMKMLMEKSGNKIPPQILPSAAAMLLMEMGKFMAEAGVAKPTSDEIRAATMLLMKMLKSLFSKPQGQPQGGAPQQPQQPGAQSPQQPVPPQAAQLQPASGLIGQPA